MNRRLEAYLANESLHCLEGHRGVIALCKLSNTLGYKDTQHFGQLAPNASIFDLLMLIEDNSGIIDAMLVWIGNQEYLTKQLPAVSDELSGE